MTAFATRSSDNFMELAFHPGQVQVWESHAKTILLLAGAQSGKDLWEDTIIPTAYGNRLMKELVVGDVLFDENRNHCKVTNTSRRFLDHVCYELCFSDGSRVIAGEDHQWSVFGFDKSKRRIKTTKQIKEEGEDFKLYVDDTRWIKYVIRVETVPTRCIEVDSPSHLYMCGNYLPTHNSTIGPFWMAREIQTKGPGDYLVVAPTFPLLSMKVLPEFLKLFKTQGKWGTFTGNPIRRFILSNYGQKCFWGKVSEEPTQIFFGHASDPDSLESATVKAAWLDEGGQRSFKLGSYEAVCRRLAVNQGRCLITTTPYGFGWLKQQLYDPWKLKKFKKNEVDVINFDSLMNPVFPREEYERAKKSMPEWKFNMMYRGMFERPAGVIYDCFDTKIHKIPRFHIPENWPRYIGLDFGGMNTAAVFLAGEVDSTGKEVGRYFLYKEYWPRQGRTAKEHTYYLLNGEPNPPIAVGGSHSEDQWRKEFRTGGEVDVRTSTGKERIRVPSLYVREPPVKEVDVGIQLTYGMIKKNNLLVFEDCKYILDELESYSYRLDDKGEATDEIEDKSMYHCCDALRYICAYLEKPKIIFTIY